MAISTKFTEKVIAKCQRHEKGFAPSSAKPFVVFDSAANIAAAVAAATTAVAATAAVTAPTAAAEQEQQNDDDPEAAAATVVTTVIVTHMEYLLLKLRSFLTSVHLMREVLWCDSGKKISQPMRSELTRVWALR